MTSNNKVKVKSGRKYYWFWLLPLGAVVLVAGLVWWSMPPSGKAVFVSFDDVAGLKAQRANVMYKGVEVGKVAAVRLDESNSKAMLELQVHEQVMNLMVESTEFWIVQPQIGSMGVEGIQTLVSGPYITFKPGEGQPARVFQGRNGPPVLEQEGLRFKLRSERRYGISVGDDLLYKQVPVGKIYAYELNSDHVVFHAQIDRPYQPLLRDNSVFWEESGLEFDASLLGISVSAAPLLSMLKGGVSFATPDTPSKEAKPGQLFELSADREDEWLQWQPGISLPGRLVTSEGKSAEIQKAQSWMPNSSAKNKDQ